MKSLTIDVSDKETVEKYKEVAELIQGLVLTESWYSETACPLQEILSCVGRLYSNRFSVTSYQNSDIAIGMYPLAYLINHRCTPNTTFVFDGDHMLIRSITDIKKGEEINVGV